MNCYQMTMKLESIVMTSCLYFNGISSVLKRIVEHTLV